MDSSEEKTTNLISFLLYVFGKIMLCIQITIFLYNQNKIKFVVFVLPIHQIRHEIPERVQLRRRDISKLILTELVSVPFYSIASLILLLEYGGYR